MEIEYIKLRKNAIGFVIAGDVYEEHVVNDCKNKSTEEIEEYLKEKSEIRYNDKLKEVE